tara:strand:+ start:2196 stop:2375 length:180 start_codon:yes stop_codon:yes gene_type:complete
MISKNAAGIVMLIASVFGLELSEGSVVEVIAAIGTVASFVLMVWNQWDRPDVKGFFFKK